MFRLGLLEASELFSYCYEIPNHAIYTHKELFLYHSDLIRSSSDLCRVKFKFN